MFECFFACFLFLFDKRSEGGRMNFNREYYNTLNPEVQISKINHLIPFLNSRMRVLEVGCGVGDISRGIRPFVKSVKGIDLSEEAINVANNKKYDGVEFERVDVFELEKNNFDCVVCVDVVEHIDYDKHGDFLAVLNGQLRAGGWLLFGTSPIRDNLFHERNVRKFGDGGDDEFRLYRNDVVKLVSEGGFEVFEVFLFDTYSCFVKGRETFLTLLPFIGKCFASHCLVAARKVRVEK